MASPYFFDKDVARHAVEFYSRFLKLPSAEWYGRAFHLRKDQAHHVGQIFGWRRRDGTRRYRRVRWWEPKRGGKSVLFAGVAHALTIGDNEPRAEVYSIARDEAQASIVYNHAKVMVGLDIARDGTHGPLASEYIGSSKDALFCSSSLSSYQPLAGTHEGKHGLSPHGILGDEVWEWKNGLLHRHLQKSTGSRRQPLDCTFSSAGIIRTYGHELALDSLAILEDPTLDPECYVVWNGPHPDEAASVDWTDLRNLAKWNPGYPHSPKKDFLLGELRKAKNKPSLENEFKQFHCGIWTEQATRWLPMHKFRDNSAAPGDPDYWKKLEDMLAGRPCCVGLDLASNRDIAALVLVFRPEHAFGRWTFLWRAYCPEDAIRERDAPRSPYRRWAEQGALFPTPGDVTDYDAIEAQLKRDAEKFAIKRADPNNLLEWDVAIDRFDGTMMTNHLVGEGFKVALYGQDYQNFNKPTRRFEDLFATSQLEHGNHPVARWMFGNAAIRKDPGGKPYIKPDKLRAPEKIDLVVAGIMGLGIQLRRPETELRSVYEKRGLIELEIADY